MTQWLLNTQRGCVIQNDDIGTIQPSTAIPVTDRQAMISKHLRGCVLFDKISGVDIDKAAKNYYGVDLKEIEKREKNYKEEMRTYESFMKEYKDPKVAAQKWAEYKQSLGVKEDKVKPIDKSHSK